MNKIISEYLNGKMGVITPILTILCISSGLFTYSGASVEAVTFDQKAKATVFAIGSGCFTYLFWHCVLKFVPSLRDKKSRYFANAVVAFGVCVIIWISSILNVSGLVGKDALEKHFNAHFAQLESTVNQKYQRALLINEIISDLKLEQKRYEIAAKAELDEGAYSSTPGNGSVLLALQTLGQRIGDLSLEAENYLEKSRRINSESLKRLDKIGKIISSNKPVAIRARDLNKESAALKTALAELNINNFAGSVSRALEGLPRSLEVISVFSRNPQVAEKQKQALELVRNDIEQTVELLNEVMDRIQELPPIEVKPFERITATRAVLIYWYNYIPYLIGGVGLDIAPLAVVYLLQNAILSRTQGEIKREEILNTTVRERIHAKISEEYERRAALELTEIKKFTNDILGKEIGFDGRGEEE